MFVSAESNLWLSTMVKQTFAMCARAMGSSSPSSFLESLEHVWERVCSMGEAWAKNMDIL